MSAPDEPAFHTAERLGRYIVLSQLGVGGQGVVLAAYDPELDRKVALKLLKATSSGSGPNDSTGQLRLLREAQAMARLNHPNVIAVHDVGTLDDQVFVAMELVDGGTLKGWMKEAPRTWRDILGVYLQAGRGLAAAHAAGLVHRDFKPDNVLIGRDGRARVTDFGLARLVRDGPLSGVGNSSETSGDSETSGSSARRSALNTNLTQQGVITGTLNYMSPEQFRGDTPDSRSDQFGYCAALYRALYQRRPFDPMELRAAANGWPDEDARSAATKPSPINEAPRGHGVPSWLRRAVMRGLSFNPADRFPSMDVMLALLERRAARARWLLPAAAGVLLAVVGVGGLSVRAAGQRSYCTGADAKLRGVWDESVGEQIDAAFKLTKVPYSGDSAREVRRALDSYAQRWVTMHQDACLATRVRGEQSEALMQMRMVCLDRRLKELGALAHVLTSADAKAVQGAEDAAQGLPSLAACADADALTARAPLPDDPALRSQIEQLEGQLTEVQALTAVGRYKDGLHAAEPVAAAASKIGYRPLKAEALYQLGWLQDRNGSAAAGEKSLVQALVAADEGRDDRLRVQASSRLVYVTGYSLRRREAAETWAALTFATLGRMGGDVELEATLENMRGVVHQVHNQDAQARAAFEHSLQLYERADPNHWRRPIVLTNLGNAYGLSGDLPRCIALLEQALHLAEKTKAPLHPALAWANFHLSWRYAAVGRFEAAIQSAERAKTIWVTAGGEETADVAMALDNIGGILLKKRDYDRALDAFRQALALHEKVQGPEHHDAAYSLEGIGTTLIDSGKPADAVSYLERALSLWGDDDGGLGDSSFQLVKAVWLSKRDAAWAKGLATSAAAAYQRAGEEKKLAELNAWVKSTLPAK